MEKFCLGCMQKKSDAPICEHCGFDERTGNLSHQLPPGTLLQNQYLVGRVLGQGGFGITYMGWDQHLSIPVAIKEYYPTGIVQRHTQISTQVQTIKENTLEFFARHKDRFLKEARTLAQLANIPEIVQVRSFFAANDTAYIVMEYIQGITVKQHLKALGRPMTEAEALTTMKPLLLALQKVHNQGLIHRDISPDNIMLPSEGGIKLIDFGTVRYMDASGRSQATEAVLKPGFSPMEQYTTNGNLGTWTDVYALCATLHYLLTGKIPLDVHNRLDEGEELAILRNTPGISDRLIHTLEKGMKIRVPDRIQNMVELYQMLYADTPIPEQKITPLPAKPQKKKAALLAAIGLAAALISGAALLLKPSAPAAEPIATTAPAVQASTLPEIPPTTAPDPNEIPYLQACKLARDGKYAQAGIAFAKLDGFKNARELSFACWRKVPNRQTTSFAMWKRNTGDYLMFHALLDDGTVASDCLRSENLTEADYQAYGPSSYRDIVSIHGNVGLRYDGTLALPGPDFPYYDELSQWTDLVAISVPHMPYEDFFLGLTTEGRVLSVGSNKYGECDVTGWYDIVAIHAGYDCSFGVHEDGTVAACGRNRQGMCEIRDWSDIIAITSYDVMSFGLRKDGTIVAAGSNYTKSITRATKKTNVAIIEGIWTVDKDGNMELDSRTWENVVSVSYYGEREYQEFAALCADSTIYFSRGRDGSYARARTWRNIQDPTVSLDPLPF